MRKEQAIRIWAVGENHSLRLGEEKKLKSVEDLGWNKVAKLIDGCFLINTYRRYLAPTTETGWQQDNDQWRMIYCFIRLNQQAEAQQEAIALSKPTNGEHWSKWKCNGAIDGQCKQRGVLWHVGLVRDSLLFPTATKTEGNQSRQTLLSQIQQASNFNGDWSSNTVSEIQQKQLSDTTKRSNSKLSDCTGD